MSHDRWSRRSRSPDRVRRRSLLSALPVAAVMLAMLWPAQARLVLERQDPGGIRVGSPGALPGSDPGEPAQSVPGGTLVHGQLAFDANATLGAFTGVTDSMVGQVTGAASLSGVRGWVEARTNTLSTHNGHRDRDMATSLDIAKYPTMRFDLDSVTAGPVEGDSVAATLHGVFTIHGQRRPAIVEGWVWIAADSVRFRGRTPMDVKAYGVGHLSRMLGIFNMNEHITVRIDVTFAPAA
jgi:polyisoprenoid-binding protein YceI